MSKFFTSSIVIPEIISNEYANISLIPKNGIEFDTSKVNWATVTRPDLVRAKIQALSCDLGNIFPEKGNSDKISQPLQLSTSINSKLNYNASKYLGPPDLCLYQTGEAHNTQDSTWLGWAFGEQKLQPLRFHWILGLDSQNALSVGNYVAQLKDYIYETQSRWYNPFTTDNQLKNATLFLWNIFEQKDLCININFPGSLELFWLKYEIESVEPLKIRISTTRIEQDQNLYWNQVYSSSILRYFAYYEQLALQSPATRVLDIRKQLTLNTESLLLSTITDNLSKLNNSGIYFDFYGETANEHNNQAIYALMSYFMSQMRHNIGIQYFTKLAKLQNELSFYVLVSRLYIDLGDIYSSEQIIINALQNLPTLDTIHPGDSITNEKYSIIHLTIQKCLIVVHESSNLLDEISENISKRNYQLKKIENSIQQLEHILSIFSNLRLPRFLLSKLLTFIDIKKSLLELNRVPWIPAQIPLTTNISSTNPDASLQDLPKWLRIIKQNYFKPIDKSVQTPGMYSKDLPGLFLTQSEKEAYSILVLILQQHGWKKLLEARSNVFFMQSDIIEKQNINKEKSISDSLHSLSKQDRSSTQSDILLQIQDLVKEEDIIQIENAIKLFDFVRGVNTNLNTKITKVTIDGEFNEQILQTLIKSISNLNLNVQLYTENTESNNNEEISKNFNIPPIFSNENVNKLENKEINIDKPDNQITELNISTISNPNEINIENKKNSNYEEFEDVDISDPYRQKVYTERYIDNLFNVMYKDLCAFSKYQHEKKEQLELYTSLDWVFIGSLLERIGYINYAINCFHKSTTSSPNTKSLIKILEFTMKRIEYKTLENNKSINQDMSNVEENQSDNVISEDKSKNISKTEIMDILKIIEQLIISHFIDDLPSSDPQQLRNQHPYVEKCIRRLVRDIGISQLREYIKESFINEVSILIINELLFDMIRVHCEGYNM